MSLSNDRCSSEATGCVARREAVARICLDRRRGRPIGEGKGGLVEATLGAPEGSEERWAIWSLGPMAETPRSDDARRDAGAQSQLAALARYGASAGAVGGLPWLLQRLSGRLPGSPPSPETPASLLLGDATVALNTALGSPLPIALQRLHPATSSRRSRPATKACELQSSPTPINRTHQDALLSSFENRPIFPTSASAS